MFSWWKPAPKYLLASELNSNEFRAGITKPPRERRSLVSIGVIDDEPFQPRTNLENLGYKISILGDPNSIDDTGGHQIILSDLQGVGRSLDNRRQGAFLIREIRKNYPDKFVIAYTGGMQNSQLTREAAAAADAFIKKDADIEAWTEKLDSIIDSLLDPYKVWRRQRLALIQIDVDTLTILKLEDAYVRSIKLGSSGQNSPLADALRNNNYSGDVKAIVQGLVSSVIFKLLGG